MRHIVISGLSGSIFSHYLKKRQNFRKKKVIEQEMGVLIFSTNFA
jgi:hypothetical protein